MKFFIDTAKVEDIKAAKRYGNYLWCNYKPIPDRERGRDFNEVIKEVTQRSLTDRSARRG